MGGTNFYIDFLLKGKTDAPPATLESRKAIDKLLEEDEGDWDKGYSNNRNTITSILYQCSSIARLRALDPVYAASFCRNDWFRLKRGLDICIQTGRYC